MKSKFRSVASMVVGACLFLLPLSGCTIAGRNIQNPNQINNTTKQPGTNLGLNKLQQSLAFDVKRADNIKYQLDRLPEVRNVRVIVNGNTAIVGYVRSHTSANNMTIKNNIQNRIKKVDNRITDIHVTEAPQVLNTIDRLSADIKNNKQLNDLGTRFNSIINSIKSGMAK